MSGARLPSATLLVALALLLVVGVVFVQSATSGSDGSFPGPRTKVHLSRIAIGIALLLIFLRLHYRVLEELAVPLYAAGLLALLALALVKLTRGGVVRWIELPFFSFQPSEPVKLFTVLVLARLLKPVGPNAEPAPLRPFLVTAIPVFLVALQPDLGTALVLPPVLLVMLWTSGTPARQLAQLVAMLALVTLPAAPFFLHDYQKARVIAYVEPLTPAALITYPHFREHSLKSLLAVSASGRGSISSYQVDQSITAIGSGGPTGKGLYLGTINYLDALPESHNDFIFAVIGEEWGLLGTLTVLTLFLVLYLGALRIAYRTREPYGRLVVIGITAHLGFQTLVNLAMTVGLTPVTGLPLPFISYGGSAMITAIAEIGIVCGIGMRPVRILHPDGLRAGTSAGSLRPLLRGR